MLIADELLRCSHMSVAAYATAVAIQTLPIRSRHACCRPTPCRVERRELEERRASPSMLRRRRVAAMKVEARRCRCLRVYAAEDRRNMLRRHGSVRCGTRSNGTRMPRLSPFCYTVVSRRRLLYAAALSRRAAGCYEYEHEIYAVAGSMARQAAERWRGGWWQV